MNQKIGLYIGCAVVCAGGAAHAGVWSESSDGGGDAGQTLSEAQMISGSPGLVTQILGSHGVGNDVDLYKICLDVPNEFSVIAHSDDGGPTPILFLFNSTGIGVKFMASTNPLEPSWFDNQWIVSAGAGEYYLGVATRNAVAVDASDQAIWNQIPGTQRQPDGPGAANPLDDWLFTVGEDSDGDYTLNITGVDYFIPTPGALALLGVGGIFGVNRRRRAA